MTVTIYAANGAVVRMLDLGHRRAGSYDSRSRAAYWDGRNAAGEPVASGVYFYMLSGGRFFGDAEDGDSEVNNRLRSS